MSAQSTVAGAVSGGWERVEIDGVEYLAHDVVAQKEGVYTYPDPNGGIKKEFVSTEELHEAAEETEQEPILLRHPDADRGPKLTINPRANWDEVGLWDVDTIEDGVAGRTLVRINEIGEHDGALRRYINQVNQLGYGEVSTGYAISGVERTNGRYDGIAYEAVQRGLTLDHLALLPEEQGDCSVEDGCGLGRANQHDETHVRVNNHIPSDGEEEASPLPEDGVTIEVRVNDEGDTEEFELTPDDLSGESEDRDNILMSIGKKVTGALGVDTIMGTGAETVPADSGRTNEPDSGRTRVDELVEDHGFTRERLAPLEGSTCLERFHEAVVEKEGDPQDNMSDPDDPGDDPGDDGGAGDGDTLTDEQRDEIKSIVDETVEESVEIPSAEDIADEIAPRVDGDEVDHDEIIDQAADEAAERAEEARAHAKNVEKVAQSDELPQIDEDRASRMNKEVVAELADDLDEADGSTDDGADRVNMGGVTPGESSFDASQYESEDDDRLNDIPSGPKRLGEGD